jgi:ApaG protein
MMDDSSQGVRVDVRPTFSLARSEPGEGTFVFSYRVEVENHGGGPVQLLFRHWRIHDAAGDDVEVDGEGVVGEQPILLPGEAHAYSSFCVLRSPVGFMEGYYTFQSSDGARFRVAIPRFALQAPLPPLDDEDRPHVMN